MKYTEGYFKDRLTAINRGLEKQHFLHRLGARYEVEKGKLTKVSFYRAPHLGMQLLSPEAILASGLEVELAENWLSGFDPLLNRFEISQRVLPVFPNGFESWCAVHYQISRSLRPERPGTVAYFRMLCQGSAGLWMLAREMTDRFESETCGKRLEDDLAKVVSDFCRKNNL